MPFEVGDDYGADRNDPLAARTQVAQRALDKLGGEAPTLVARIDLRVHERDGIALDAVADLADPASVDQQLVAQLRPVVAHRRGFGRRHSATTALAECA